MIKRILLFVAILFGAMSAIGQTVTGARYDGAVIDQSGKPVVGINVRVCPSPASGQPCTPLSTIYSDVNLQFPAANPIATDYVGNFYFYVPSGTYELEFSGANLVTKQVPDVTITTPGGGGGGGGCTICSLSNTFSGTTNTFSNTVVVTNLTATNAAVTSLTPGGCVQAGLGGALTTPNSSGCTGGIFDGITITGPQPLVLNGDFESSAVLPPDGWSPNSNATITFETAAPYEGLQTVKMVSNADPAGAGMFAVNTTPAPPGSVWYITGAEKSDGTLTAGICLSFIDLNGSQIGSANCATTNSTNYQLETELAAAPAGSVLVAISLQSSPVGIAGTTWYDAIALNRADQFSPVFKQAVSVGPVSSYQNLAGTTEWMLGLDASNNLTWSNALGTKYVSISQLTGQFTVSAPIVAPSLSGTGLTSGNCLTASGIQITSTTFPCQNLFKFSMTTTSAATDSITITGLTTASHCAVTPTNAAAAVTGTFIAAKVTNLLTIGHAPTAGMTFDIICTPN